MYADDLRPSRFEWIANNRVTFTTNKFGTEVEEYFVDSIGYMSGMSSQEIIARAGVTPTAAKVAYVQDFQVFDKNRENPIDDKIIVEVDSPAEVDQAVRLVREVLVQIE